MYVLGNGPIKLNRSFLLILFNKLEDNALFLRRITVRRKLVYIYSIIIQLKLLMSRLKTMSRLVNFKLFKKINL